MVRYKITANKRSRVLGVKCLCIGPSFGVGYLDGPSFL